MGMGEPLMNYDHVLRSIKILTDNEGLAFSRRNSYLVDPNAADYFDRQVLAMDQLADDYSAALVSAVLEGF